MAVAMLVAVWLAMIDVGARVMSMAAAAALVTLTEPLVPVTAELTVSVAVTVRLPAVFRVTETVRVPVPATSGVSAGNVAAPSVLVK